MGTHGKKSGITNKKMKKIIRYDTQNDILFVHNGFGKSEKFETNIVAGDLVLDLSTKGRVRGIEFLNATKFLEGFGIDEKMLENLADVEFKASVNRDSVILDLILDTKSTKHDAAVKIVVPLSEPITAQQANLA